MRQVTFLVAAMSLIASAQQEPTVKELIKQLESGDAAAKVEAAHGLGGIGPDAKDALPALKALLDDKDEMAKSGAAGAISRIEGK